METITDHPINAMLADLFGYGQPRKRPTSRSRVFAVMANGDERMIYKSRQGWAMPNGHAFSSHLDTAKAAYMKEGAVKFIRK